MASRSPTLIDAFQRAETEFSAEAGFVFPEGEISFGALAKRSRKLAGMLAGEGVSPGDRVLFSTRDDLLAATLFIGIIRSGATAIFLDPETHVDRAAALLVQAAPRLLILDEELHAAWHPGAGAAVIPVEKRTGTFLTKLFGRRAEDASFEERLERLDPAALPGSIDPEAIAYILYTSGTLGNPKGISISHRALNGHLQTLGRVYGLSRDSRILNPLVLSHADGMIQGPVLAFFHGAKWYRPFRFSVRQIEDLLEAVYRERITHLFTVPTILSLLNRFMPAWAADCFAHEEFRYVISCGAHLDKNLWRMCEERLGIRLLNVYGLTETVAGGLFAGIDRSEGFRATVGTPVDCEARILDAAGRESSDGESGELALRGDLLMSGYFRSPEATAEVMGDGWLRTGDIARRDALGRFQILGRRKSVIISGGVNVHPDEVTEVLLACPGVADAVTFGKADGAWGELIVSAVVLSGSAVIGESELFAHCRSRLEPAKVPADIRIISEVPRGRSGKPDLERLREIAERKGTREEGFQQEADEVRKLLIIAQACFKVPENRLSLSTSPETLPEWDSLAHLELAAALERGFGVRFAPADVIRLGSLREALEIISRRRSANTP